MKDTKERKKRRRNLKFITVMLASITAAVWLVLLLIKYLTTGVSLNSLLDDIISNILGILPPILLFNFLYEYFTKEYVAEEMSEKMMETLTGNTQVMETFKEDVRKNFIKSTIRSLVGKQKEDMVYGVLTPYIADRPYDMHVDYEYNIDICTYSKCREIGSKLFSPSRYFMVKENLSYTKALSDSNKPIDKFSVGFFVDAVKLEKELKQKSYLFRESLKIREEELKCLIRMNKSDQKKFVTDCLHLQLFIDDIPLSISTVEIGEFGIAVDLLPPHPITQDKFNIEICFVMPQMKRRSEFLVSIPQPTFSPKINFTYSPAHFKITAYQFLNNSPKPIKDPDALHGRIVINPAEWVYPVKGVLFIIDTIDDEL